MINRRQFLRGTLATGGAAALAGCRNLDDRQMPPAATSAPAVIKSNKIELVTAGWPLGGMPSAADIAASPTAQVYADILQTWLNDNPNVEIKTIEANIWSAPDIRAALQDGSAPTFVPSISAGNWTPAGTRTAFAQGWLADLTDATATGALKTHLVDKAYRAYERTGLVNNRAYYYPIDASMNVLWYRRDLALERGLAPLTADSQYADLWQMIAELTSDERHGFGAPAFFLRNLLNSHGFDLLSNVPDSDSKWRWALDYSDPLWVDVVMQLQQMIHQDKVILSEPTMGHDNPYRALFREGSLGSIYTNIIGAFAHPKEGSFASMAQELDKPFDEVFGFVPLPRGTGYLQEGMKIQGGIALPATLSPEGIEAALGLVEHIFFGELTDAAKAATYEETGDLQRVYSNPLPIDGRFEFDGVPGSFADAWGETISAEIQTIVGLPQRVEESVGFFFPTEELDGPERIEIDSMWTRFVNDPEAHDFANQMRTVQEAWNEQSSTYPATVSARNFRAGIRHYYSDVSRQLEEFAPDFYAQRFAPWFAANVEPQL